MYITARQQMPPSFIASPHAHQGVTTRYTHHMNMVNAYAEHKYGMGLRGCVFTLLDNTCAESSCIKRQLQLTQLLPELIGKLCRGLATPAHFTQS